MGYTFLPSYRLAIGTLSANDGGATTDFLSRIYVKRGASINPSLLQLVQLMYGSGIKRYSSSSEAASEINSEVSRVTHGRIERLVESKTLDGLSVILVSALYFKDEWRWAFPSHQKRDFLTAFGEKSVTMMALRQKLRYNRFSTFDAIELPYKDKAYCMLLLKPIERNMTAVNDLRSQLDSLNLRDLLDDLSTHDAVVTMPRFKIETTYNLRSALFQLGMRKLFTSDAELATFNGLTVTASEVFHKVFLEVDEKGTEAAAAVTLINMLSATASQPVDFRLDQPFFAIVYNKKLHFNMFSAYVASP